MGRGSLILGFIWLSWSGGGLSSPLNSVFRWREPERWEGDCGAGVSPPPHLGGTCVWTGRGEGWLHHVVANQKRHADEAVISRTAPWVRAALTGPLLPHAGDHRGGGRAGEPRGGEEPPQGEEAQLALSQLEKLVAALALFPRASQRGARPELRGQQRRQQLPQAVSGMGAARGRQVSHRVR